MVLDRDLIDVTFCSLPVPQDFAADDGVAEVAVGKIYIRQELVVERGEQRFDVGVLEAGVIEQDDRPGDRAVGEVLEIDGGEVLAVAQGKKALRRGSADGAFPSEFHVSEVMSQRLRRMADGTAAIKIRQPLPLLR